MNNIGKVWFIGAGPGDPELITVKGKRLIEEADLIIYAGSLVPKEVVSYGKAGVPRLDSASMTLEETHAAICKAVREGKNVARVHTGDSALYGAVREQKLLLDEEGITSEIVPGVTCSFAAAAAAGVGFTVPESVQSFAVTRLDGRTPVPKGQSVSAYAKHGGSLAIYLSAGNVKGIVAELRAGGVLEDTPIIIAYRVSWPDQKIYRATLATLETVAATHNINRQTVFLVLPGEREKKSAPSRLYAAEFEHNYRESS